MLTTEFKKTFLPVLKNKMKVKEYSEKSYSKRYGNISCHENEYNKNVFNYIIIDEQVFHIAYPYDVELTKEGKNGMYGIIKGHFIKPIDLEYLKPYMNFQETSAAFFQNENKTVFDSPKTTFFEEPKKEVADEIQQFFNILVNRYRVKLQEYSTGSFDSNFVKGARILGESKEKTLLGYATKHLVSVFDIVEGKKATKEAIDEKFGDIFVYFSILRIMLLEKEK